MSKEVAAMLRKEKARRLRNKKPVIPRLCLREVREWLDEAMTAAGEYTYADEETHDELVNALDGDEEEAHAYRMAFAGLSADCEQFYNDLEVEWVPKCFDDMLVAIASATEDVGWYDEDARDYYGLNDGWETESAILEARDRLKRLTKDELIDAARQCMRIALNFVAMQSRLDDLQAAAEIVRGLNGGLMRDVQTIEHLYEDMQSDDWKKQDEARRRFDQAVELLPPEIWVR